jgi:hypothetical protein
MMSEQSDSIPQANEMPQVNGHQQSGGEVAKALEQLVRQQSGPTLTLDGIIELWKITTPAEQERIQRDIQNVIDVWSRVKLREIINSRS